LLPGGRRALTANHTADSVSLVDLANGRVLAEIPTGHKPTAVACSADGRLAAVSNLWTGTVSLLAVEADRLRVSAIVEVGPLPRGLAFAADGTLYGAVAGADEVVAIDTRAGRVTHRWPAPREPWALAPSADGRLLAAASSRGAAVCLWDTRTRSLLWQRTIEDGFNLHGLAFTADQSALVCSHGVRRDFPVSRDNIEQGWVIDSRLTRLSWKADAEPALEQLSLDLRGQAVGDPHGVAFDAAGRTLAVTASGTHELLVLACRALAWTAADPGDFLDPTLAADSRKFRRIPLGGRPMGLAFVPGTSQVVVANYLLDAVQVVDVDRGEVVRRIDLGGPAQPSIARQGEALFYDARRSHHQWFSCHTCHTDGHTCGRLFDTLNDDSYGNPKLTPSLRGVAWTGPWTWHGWQKDLGAAVAKSYTETMFGPRPAPDEARAVAAFLATLEHPPNPHPSTAAVRRGAALFAGKARCTHCHQGNEYTAGRNYDVKLEPDGSPYSLWNPPTLRGLWDRGPYLHDGRAGTLDELLHGPHAPEKLGGQPLSPAERTDLVAFLRSL
jgi:YVTN family beta-propeller protein